MKGDIFVESLIDNLNMESDTDEDTNDTSEPPVLFPTQFKLQAEVTASKMHAYILHMCGGKQTSSRIAVSFSDRSCAVYDINNVERIATADGHNKPVSGIRFSPKNDNLLYSSSLDGTVKLWDLRTDTKNCKTEFIDDTSDSNVFKPLTTFDVSPDDRFVVAGSQLVDNDAYLLFWDARSSKLLGGYWESHADDITQVRFQPSNKNIMATGSTDGLINIFDVSQGCEDDALQYSLNTSSSVDKIFWNGTSDFLSCITHTEDLQLWKIDGEAPENEFSRESVAKYLQRKSVDTCYLIDVHQKESSGTIMLLAESRTTQGGLLRTFEVTSDRIQPMCQFVNNKQIVRASWYFENDDTFVTGGEAGLLSVWRQKEVANGHKKLSPPSPKSSKLKMPSKFQQHRESPKPY